MKTPIRYSLRLPLLTLALGLPFGLAATALAQSDQPPAGPRPGHRPPPPLVRALDVDHDGVISAGEIASAASSLRLLDTNADGVISAEELHPPRPADAPTRAGQTPPAADGDRPRPPSPLMHALDTDRDGALSAAEIANAPASLRALDKNGDGQLTGDELRPAGGPPPRE